MNVIFLDFDGVLATLNDPEDENLFYSKVEQRISILSDICKKYNCKIVIEASARNAINEKTLEIDEDNHWVQFIFNMFKKYNIECIGRTPTITYEKDGIIITSNKDDEILLYLYNHPEIEHYCVLDDNDTVNLFHWEVSDLDKVKEHLVSPIYYSNNYEEEGLLPKHIEEVGRVLALKTNKK